MIGDIDKRIERAMAKTRLAFRGVISLVNAAAHVQFVSLDGLAGEPLPDMEMFQNYGHTSNPPAGTMCIVLPIGGRTAHSIIIATEHATSRLKNLKPGESALYDDLGQKIHLTRDGIVIDGAGLPINVINTPSIDFDTPLVNMSGDLSVVGKITGTDGMEITGPMTNNGKNVGSSHQHGGVQIGSGICGVPV